MSKKHNPTPFLGQPNSQRQQFTYSENRLLDQITMEIVEAWKSDLRKLNDSYSKSINSSRTIERISDSLLGKLEIIAEIIQKDEFEELYRQFHQRNLEINLRLEEINKRSIEIETIVKRLDEKKTATPIPDHVMKNESSISNPNSYESTYQSIKAFFKRFS